MSLISGIKIANQINSRTARLIKRLGQKGIIPSLAVVLVGNDQASLVYVRQKEKSAKTVKINFKLHHFPATIAKEKLIKKLRKIQRDKKLSGIIIQLPLPERLYKREVLNSLKPQLDIDYLTDYNLGSLASRSNKLEPPTAGAMVEILRSLNISLKGKHAVVVGEGVLVGRPLSVLLLNEDSTVTVCNKYTQNLKEKCLAADIIISCVGKRSLIKGSMVKKGAVVIDAGFSFFGGRASGDVKIKEVLKKAKLVTPTPGGVGPVTVAKLLYNAALNAEIRSK